MAVRVTDASLPVIYAAIGKAYLGSRDSLRTRTKWTADHQQLIDAVAEDPIENNQSLVWC